MIPGHTGFTSCSSWLQPELGLHLSYVFLLQPSKRPAPMVRSVRLWLETLSALVLDSGRVGSLSSYI